MPIAERTTEMERERFLNKINTDIDQAFTAELNDSTASLWEGAFWASNLILRQDELVLEAIELSLNKCEERGPYFCRWALESAITQEDQRFSDEFKQIYTTANNVKLKVMATYGFQQVTGIKLNPDTIFVNKDNPLVVAFNNYEIQPERPTFTTREIKEVLHFQFPKPGPVFYSFQRSGRNYPGLTILREANGNFLRDENGQLIAVPQLARAISNMPGYLTNGNTPNGVLAITGTGFSENVFIGPSETLITRLPYEGEPDDFFPEGSNNTHWSPELYEQLIPNSLDKKRIIWEAFYAGKAGRTEIISHGTTINPEFYKNESYYPFTPSLGCLTANETWNLETGRRMESDQSMLIEMWKSQNSKSGYFVVIDIDHKQQPVKLEEIEQLVQ